MDIVRCSTARPPTHPPHAALDPRHRALIDPPRLINKYYVTLHDVICYCGFNATVVVAGKL